MPFLLVHTADSFTPRPPPPFFMVFDRRPPRARSKAALSELVFSPFFFFFSPFGPGRRGIWGWPPLNSPCREKGPRHVGMKVFIWGGRSSVGEQMESRPSGYVAKDTAWQSARAEIFRSQRQTRAQTLSWWRNFIRVKKIYIFKTCRDTNSLQWMYWRIMHIYLAGSCTYIPVAEPHATQPEIPSWG